MSRTASTAAIPDIPKAPPPDPWAPSAPTCRWLSNGRLVSLITAAGTGDLSWRGEALTRWRGDRVADDDGAFVYLRDADGGAFASIGLHPVRDAGGRHAATWRPGVFRLEREWNGIAASMDVCVDPDADVELRRLTLRHDGRGARRVEVTTYAEVVLHAAAADASHPAFSKLFVQTEREGDVLLARRRPRAPDERHPWLAHALFGPGEATWETDRERFIGRGRDRGAPRAMTAAAPLSGALGSVLDPIVCLRRIVTLPPAGEVVLWAAMAAADTRDDAIAAARRGADPDARDAAFAAAEDHAPALAVAHDLGPDEAEYLAAAAGAMRYGDPRLRPAAETLRRARGTPAVLERLGVREGRPFVLVLVDETPAPVVALLSRAAAWWDALGAPADVRCVGRSSPAAAGDELVGAWAAMTDAERAFAQSAAAWVVAGRLPELTGATLRGDVGTAGAGGPPAAPASRGGPRDTGRFEPDGAYALAVTSGVSEGLPPSPWVNVIAHETFGCIVGETGAGSTWGANSREQRLTPWSNDPVCDPHDEAWFLRDDDSGDVGSPFPGPVADGTRHDVRHDLGVSSFRSTWRALEREATVFVAPGVDAKLVRVRLRNLGEGRRRLTLVSYQALVLGGSREEHGRHVMTAQDPVTGALIARTARDAGYPPFVAYAAVIPPPGAAIHATADREAFLGRNRSVASPAALRSGAPLDGRTGAGLDPCFAFQVALELEPGASAVCDFALGAARDDAAARDTVEWLRAPGAIDAALESARRFWASRWSGLRVRVPEPALEPLVNGWLPYQTLSCRIWGRSAFYQSGGAFGFRDQLQDASSLLLIRPELTRAQIVLHAAHQFVEGDVLHWWHPGTERGLRTRFADDLLWLPYVAAQYVASTGDASVLGETAAYLTAPALEDGEDEVYLKPEPSGDVGDVYDHCCRAIDRSLATGAHGLPLFGTGDWNDGMNRVGREGRGESVWMGFFLCAVLDEFAPLLRARGDAEREARYAAHRARLDDALNDAGWDGDWYRRGYYDDGTPLGSRDGDECRIDALAQAWAVLSGVAPADRAERCMAEVERQLISEPDGIVRLLTPPFDRTPHDPGYIKGYVPGVRENGGQYTHAALWVARAFATMGRRDRAASLLTMLSPITHASSPERAERYKLEPYVVAADVYGAPPHVGRGGWSWYTGSSGWMYRVTVESVLGLSLVGGAWLRIRPCIPDGWPGFEIDYAVAGSEERFHIEVENPDRRAESIVAATIDGEALRVEDGAAWMPVSGRRGSRVVMIRMGPR